MRDFRYIAVIFFVVVMAGFFYLMRDESAQEKREVMDFEEALRKQRKSDFGFSGPGADLHRILAMGKGPDKASLEAHTRLYFRYPPNSRPLSNSMNDLLNPRAIQNSKLPLIRQADRKKIQDGKMNPDDLPESDYSYRFWGPKNAIVGKEALIVYLEVYANGSNDRVPLTINRAMVKSDLKTGAKLLNPPLYNDSGANGDEYAGDNIWTFSWVPGAQTREYWGELLLEVEFTLGDQFYVESQIFFANPKTPGRFTGQFVEKVEAGSLYIEPEVSIDEPGHYIIEANLYHSATGEPLHWAYFNGDLTAGTQFIPLMFFGKIFHEKNRDGKFELRELRGYKNNVPFALADLGNIAKNPSLADTTAEPDKIMLADYPQKYVSKPYSLGDFSDAEYTSPEKTDAMNEY